METARIAVQASLTGHRVFSTLHTNDSATAFLRLADMGVEPFLVGATVRGVVAQRLVRVLCEACAVPVPDLKTLRPDVPPAMARIIQRMLTRDRTKRYASMREVALDLERVMKAGSAVQPARATASQEKAPRPGARPQPRGSCRSAPPDGRGRRRAHRCV